MGRVDAARPSSAGCSPPPRSAFPRRPTCASGKLQGRVRPWDIRYAPLTVIGPAFSAGVPRDRRTASSRLMRFDPVVRVRRQPGQAQGARRDLGRGRGLAREDHETAPPSASCCSASTAGSALSSRRISAALHPVTVRFPPCGDLFQNGAFLVGQFARVHLEAHVPLCGDPGAEPDVQNAPRGVAFARADVAAGDRHGQEQRGVVLHLQPLQRVVGIRQPDALGALQDTEVDAPAARGAAFDLDMREVGAKTVEQACRSRASGPRPASAGRGCGPI